MTEEQQRVVERLLGVMAGELDVAELDRILSPALVLHVEGRAFGAAEGMKAFLTFVRRRVPRLTIVCDRKVSHEDGTVSLVGRWLGERRGRRVSSREVSATYRIEGGAVVEVWTERANYEFFFGRLVRSWMGFWLVSAWIAISYRLGRRGSRPASSLPRAE